MNAYILQTDVKIVPFQECSRDCTIGNRKISDWHLSILNKHGYHPCYISDINEIEDSEEYIVFFDNVFFSEKLFLSFVAKSKKSNTNTVCSLELGLLTQRTAVSLQDVRIESGHVEYNLYYVPGMRERVTVNTAVVIDAGSTVEALKIPAHMSGSGEYLIPLSDKLIVQIDHWVNLWATNILTTFSDLVSLLNSPLRQIFLIAKAMSINKWRMLKKHNKIGNGCDIHPSVTCIEGSVIGNNVVIKAGAVIRESIIGDNTVIGNNVTVESSVIGSSCTILHGHIMYSVLMDEVFSFTQMISASMIGSRSFIGSGVVLTDFRFDKRNIFVYKNSKLVDCENLFVGSCLGHETYLGSGIIISPGRAIPGNSRLLPEKNRVIGSMADLKMNKII